jgi:serine/threonine protein kinase
MDEEIKRQLESIKEDKLNRVFRNAKLGYIASGSYNAVYSIDAEYSTETYDYIPIGNHFVLRMTKPNIREKEYIYNGAKQPVPYPNPREYQEIIGLRYQAIFSKSKRDGGFGCPHIGKVYDFGKYSDLDLFKSKLSEDVRRNFNDDKQLILTDIPEYSKGSSNAPYIEGTYGIIEKVNGGTLAERIDTSIYTTNAIFIKYIIFDLLQTADCLHKNGVVHLDIKPENIMLVYDGNANMSDTVKHTTIKLVDFGFCRKVNETINHVVGTPLFTSQYFVDDIYLTDEKTYQNDPIEGRTHKFDYKDDIWSIGVVLCELMLNAGSLNALEFLDYTLINNRKYSIRPNDTFTDALGGYDPKLKDFLKCIFREHMDPNDKSPVSTAEELLNHPWLAADPPNNAGGRKKKRSAKRKTKRSNKKSKQRKTKSKQNKKKDKK